MPLLDHFHPPLHGPRRWEGFHHSWATFIAQQLNQQQTLPPNYFAVPEIAIGPKLDNFEVRVYQELGGDQLRGVIGLVSPMNKNLAASRRACAAKFAAYLSHDLGAVLVDIVTSQTANLHQELVDVLGMTGQCETWEAPTGLYAVAYRVVPFQQSTRLEVWTEPLKLGGTLPVLLLWLTLDLCVPVRLEESYLATCQSLRISA